MTSGVSPRVLSAARTAAISTSEYSPPTKRRNVAVLSSRLRFRRLRASSTSLARMPCPLHDIVDDAAAFGREDRFGMELHSELRSVPVLHRHHHSLRARDGVETVGKGGGGKRMVAAHRER